MRILLALMLIFSGVVFANPGSPEIEWDDLIPDDYRPDKIMAQFGDIGELEDDDPRTKIIMDQLKAIWDDAPIVPEFDGKRVKLPGFVVPLEGDGKKLSEFLLVPYYGACIHVPPPPANQTIYVRVPKADAKIRRAFDTVWVTGTMSAKPIDSDLATAGYQLEAELVEPYEE